MKKLLAILEAVGLTATTSVAVVSCSGDKANWKLNDDKKVTLNTVKGVKTDLGKVADFSYKTIQNKFFWIKLRHSSRR
ncbi:lipoprotein [Mesoplasma melaleucae]|uniref:Lipoprotein n=1 Tax=Mesoplasma melaleucae TaxID=81459 RepID=A0A2K8NUV5_9MOLU|nr:lipoprotein [Mesoplasma melaleucae]ATZ17622.1 hypothetical protein EMELA_v1c00300 [Mesoplasma melaleucae]